MEKSRKKPNSLFSFSPRALIFILSAAAAGLTLLVLPFSYTRNGIEQSVQATATPVPTPTVAISSVNIVLSSTPVPKATEEAYPEDAMDLVVNGTVVCTLPSGEIAAALPEKLLKYWAEQPLGQNEYLVSAQIDAEVTVAAPSGEGTLMSGERALAYLENNPSLLPVLRVTRIVDVEETALVDSDNASSQLPPGITVIRRLERPSYMLFYTDKEYEGLTLLSRTEQDGFLIGSAASGRITETGATPDPSAPPTPTPAPGSLAAECAVPLTIPVKGTVQTRYGRDADGLMHYGIDYLTESGYAVYSPGDGTVIYCGPRGSLGNVIEILHEDTGFVSRLIGMDREMNVELWQRIKKSDRLGKVAAAPGKWKPVFRYELLKNGIPVDPLLYIK